MRVAGIFSASLLALTTALGDAAVASPAAARGSSTATSSKYALVIRTNNAKGDRDATPARLTAQVAQELASACGSSPASGASAVPMYAGHFAVSPPLARKGKAEDTSEIVLFYTPEPAEPCTLSADGVDGKSGAIVSILSSDLIAPSSTKLRHLVFVAQEALDPSLLDTQRSNASWTSPMLLNHVTASAPDQITADASKKDVAQWTWEQQMRALLGESSNNAAAAPEVANEDTPTRLLPVLTTAQEGAQAVFVPAQTGEEVARVTDIQSLAQHVRLLQLDSYWALVQMDDAALLSHELFLPSDSRIALVPSPAQLKPLITSAAGGNNNSSEPTFPKPQFSSLITSILASHQISTNRLEQDARQLTAEDANAGWVTRHSGTQGGRKAAEWVLGQMSQSLRYVAGAECALWEYDPLFSPNVVCTIKADPQAVEAQRARVGVGRDGEEEEEEEPEGLVLVSAHYDSRGTFGYIEAPGGDDDGSGTTLLLGVARVIGEYRMRFARDVHLVAHSGEEQGLVGSKYYARHLREKKIPVRLALQSDMVAYHNPGEPAQLAFPNRLATESATLYVQALAQLYTPELVVGYCTACCSDHQSYWEQDFAATWLFERNGAIADPAYHQSYDLTDRSGYDFNQLRGATQVALATILETAHFYL